nr:MFS transporter [Methanosarcina horonobensis]
MALDFLRSGTYGLIGMIGVLRFPETLPEVSDTPLSQIAHTYSRLLLNPSYIVMVLVMSASLFPLYSYIAGSSDIYINGFGMTEQKYSYFFAFNAMALMVGSFSCLRLTKNISSKHLMTAGFAGIFLGGVILLLTGQHGPWSFALPMFLITFSLGLSRPPSNNLVLEQVDRDAGSASSLLIFSYFTLGAVGMWFISLEWRIRSLCSGQSLSAAELWCLQHGLFCRKEGSGELPEHRVNEESLFLCIIHR